MSFGEQLRALREERGMSLRALSRETGLALSHLQYLETDAKAPGDATLEKLAKALRVPVGDLKAEQLTGQVTYLLKESGANLNEEQRQELLDAVERAAQKGRRT
jgi:transcriptional regulator with XRE-family HTH domain